MPKPNVREPLIEAGLRTFHQRGFHGCGVQDITAAAGVPKGSFYNHFESKEALALAALERFWDIGTERRAVLVDRDLDPVERLRRHFTLLNEAVARGQFEKGCLIGNFSAELSGAEAVQARLRDLYTSWCAAIEVAVAQARAEGRLASVASDASVATYLVSAWEGAVLRSKVDRSGAVLDDFVVIALDSLFT